MNTPKAVVINNFQDGRQQIIPVYYGEDNCDEKRSLANELDYEKKLRTIYEEQVKKLQAENEQLKRQPRRSRRTKEEIDAEEKINYSEFKCNGVKRAQAAEPIRSYDDFVAIQNYFLSKNNIRDWMLWTIGVSLGLRVSDLFNLKIGEFLNEDKQTFRERVKVYEIKTSKLNNILITEAVKQALTKYFDSINWNFSLGDYLFQNRYTKDKIESKHGWKIISNAGKALKLPIHIGSHTMRKSFANIAACVDNSSIDMNSITKVQGLLNHSDQRVTMRYLSTYQKMYDKARIAVSDFVLGKTQCNELIVGLHNPTEDIISRLDSLEKKFFDEKH